MSEQLTTVILEGALGRKFGRKWKLKVSSPSDALRLINANKPGFSNWIRENLDKYSRYRVVVDKEARDHESLNLTCKARVIRFVPLMEGRGGVGKIIAGAVLVVASMYVPMLGVPYATGVMSAGAAASVAGVMSSVGVALILGGAVEMLMKKPKGGSNDYERKDKTSHYFDGPVNTEVQGVPVPLIYGTVLTGSHAISAAMTINEIPL
ncbi:hypothetical protein LJC19_04625 [Oxalobacter sp. OttesenSCG-928-P03]|nr:hypothetical protein [Oxalobacter sp. OttesenSCG-928-P03]